MELRNQKASMEGVLFLEREKILTDYSKKIRNYFDQAESLLAEVKRGEIANKRSLINNISSIQSALNKESPNKIITEIVDDKYSHLRLISFSDIQINMTVFSVNIKKNVKVIQLNSRKQEIQIQHGALSVWVTSQTLRWPSGSKPIVPNVRINIERAVRGDIEIDCRGMRLDEFQKACEQAIDEVFSGEIPFVTIIHGHGDGILKNWLRNTLRKEHKDLRWENIEGNDGCTKISF